MSSPLIFLPDKFGKTAKEPCDIVCANHDAVVFMFLCRQENDAGDKNSNRRVKAIAHNLKQARGFLKRWRAGNSVTGSNSYGSFSVQYTRTLRVAVLSVIQCYDGRAIIHSAEQDQLRVDLCATIPQSVIEILVKSYASMPDVIAFLKDNISDTSEDDAIQKSREYIIKARDKAGFIMAFMGPSDPEFVRIQGIHSTMRNYLKENASKTFPGLLTLQRFFGDSYLEDWMRTLVSIKLLAETAISSPESLNYPLTLTGIEACISVAINPELQYLEEIGSFADQLFSSTPEPHGSCDLHILFVVDPFLGISAEQVIANLRDYGTRRRERGWQVAAFTIPQEDKNSRFGKLAAIMACVRAQKTPSNLAVLLGRLERKGDSAPIA